MNAPGCAVEPGSLAALFVDLADEEHTEIIREDLAEVSPRELAEQFREACGVLEGFVVAGEALSMGTYIVLPEARRRAEATAGLPVSDW